MPTLARLILCVLLATPASAADRRSPPLTVKRTGGAPVSLAQYRGKVIAIAFIRTTCSHCQQLTTELNQLAPAYTARGVQFLECAFNEDAITTMPDSCSASRRPFPLAIARRPPSCRTCNTPSSTRAPSTCPTWSNRSDRHHPRRLPGESAFFRDPGTNIRAVLDKLLRK